MLQVIHFTINTYDVNTGDKIDNSFTITKKAEDKKDDTTKDNVEVKEH